jgi:hypothetical protein
MGLDVYQQRQNGVYFLMGTRNEPCGVHTTTQCEWERMMIGEIKFGNIFNGPLVIVV